MSDDIKPKRGKAKDLIEERRRLVPFHECVVEDGDGRTIGEHAIGILKQWARERA